MRALVAESNVVTRVSLRRILERSGFTVEELRDELAAACLLHAPEAPELALLALDTLLADFGQVCAAMREAKPDIYIVALVPEARRIEVGNVLDAGADDFLIKPASLQEAEARVRVIGGILAARRGEEGEGEGEDVGEAGVERPRRRRSALNTLLDEVTSTDTLATVFNQMGLTPVEEISPGEAGGKGVFSVWSPLLITVDEKAQWLNTRIDLDEVNAMLLFGAVERYGSFSEERLLRVLQDIMSLVQDGIRTRAAGVGGAQLHIPIPPVARPAAMIPPPPELAGRIADRKRIGLRLRNDLRLLMTVTMEPIRKEAPVISSVHRMDVLAHDVQSAEYQIMLLRAGTMLSDDYIRKIQAFIHSKNLSQKVEVFRPPRGTAAFLNEIDVDVRG